MRSVGGALLVQDADVVDVERSQLKVVSRRVPTEHETKDMMFAWRVVRHVKSNAIVFCKDRATIGVGAGQMSRIYSTRIAVIKAADAGLAVKGSVMASDAFLPFRDNVDAAAEQWPRLTAEFDAEIQPFYASLGFEIEPVGDGRYRGVRE